ncbi:MAG TPA: glutathione ABC transporter substrate-binding protein [Candidatus Methylomirabilis sp.]|nr:glutathione ABC transporter substrate-binding protein [Candidatus Methylomirabilis sp.]
MKQFRGSGIILLGSLLLAAGLASQGLAAEKVITIAQYADAVSLDPQHTNDNASYSIEKPMLEGLIGFNEKMEQIPQLAERWDASPDARVYTFHLRKGVKFHDGTPFNAAAVKANFDRVRNPDNKLRRYTLYKIISQIDVIDDSTVRFTLSEPFGAMIATFAHPAGGINSPAAVQKYGADYGKNPVGTGPYKFQEWVPNDHITMVKNPDYWDKANAAKVDKIIVKPVPEEGTRIAMLQKGDAQFINFVPYIQAETVKADRNLSLASTEAIYTFWVAMNAQKKPFSDVRVRQAMNYAIDKEAVIKAVLRGQGKPADSPLAPRVWGYTSVKTYPHDLAKAKALLAEAGYPTGFKAVLRGGVQTDAKDAMVAIQGQLKQVGVEVEVLALPAAALSAERFKPLEENKGEMDFAGWSPSTGDADWGIRPLLTKDNWPPTNFTIGFYTNPKVEEAIKAGLQTADPAKRKVAYAEAQRVIMDDCPWIFLWVNNLLGGSRANVGGISLQPDAIGFYRSVYYK